MYLDPLAPKERRSERKYSKPLVEVLCVCVHVIEKIIKLYRGHGMDYS